MRAPRPKKRKKTAFVPRSLFLSAIATTSVIPLCACGGSIAQPEYSVGAAFVDSGVSPDAKRDVEVFTVAQAAFDSGTDTSFIGTVAACCFDATFDVATTAFDAGVDATTDATVDGNGFLVAATGFDGSAPDAGDSGLGFTVGSAAFDSGA
jgi:hypothetical protein